MKRVVLKFGGSSVRDAEHLRNAAAIIGNTYREGNQVVVVLSAQGDTTDELIAKAKEINPEASQRELDMLLSAGEQMSVALCAMALEAMQLPAVSLAAWQVGIHTTGRHGNAHIRRIDLERMQKELNAGNIVLVAGFQGIDDLCDVTTLGRGGSDTSAVALAAVLHADVCRIYTDVDGVHTADPRLVPNAVKLAEITYDEMLELANQGAQVLHGRSVKLAKKHHVPIEVLSSLEQKPGTEITAYTKQENANIAGVTKDIHIDSISVMGVTPDPGAVFRLFSCLGRTGIHTDMRLLTAGSDDLPDVHFIVSKADTEKCVALLEKHRDALGFSHIVVKKHVAKVSLVGMGICFEPNVTGRMCEALKNASIHVQMVFSNGIRASALVDENNACSAVKAVHQAFFENGNAVTA